MQGPASLHGLFRWLAQRLFSGTERLPENWKDAKARPIRHVERPPIGKIRPYENNPRVNDQAVDAVAASIREFGFRQPIVVDADGVIIVGHVRYKAALKLGLKNVPIHVAKDLTPEQIKAYRI